MSTQTKAARPLSPHLQVYRPQLTSALSIFHRIAGVALTVGLVVVVLWLSALSGGPDSYASFVACAKSTFGQVVLFGLTLAFTYHFCAGIRHLFWDCGLFLEIKEAYKTGYTVLGATLLLSALIWLKAYGVF